MVNSVVSLRRTEARSDNAAAMQSATRTQPFPTRVAELGKRKPDGHSEASETEDVAD